MILQAVIFAGAHANYPSYPAYSRLIELIIPSLFWGAVYLRFGLLPVIISHFGYDVVWFALPIFTSSSTDLFFDRFMVIFLFLAPLWVVVKSRYSLGMFSKINPDALNSAFSPPKESTLSQDSPAVEYQVTTISRHYKKFLYVFSGIGLICLLMFPKVLKRIDFL